MVRLRGHKGKKSINIFIQFSLFVFSRLRCQAEFWHTKSGQLSSSRSSSLYRASHDVTVVMLVPLNEGTTATLMSPFNPTGTELCSYAFIYSTLHFKYKSLNTICHKPTHAPVQSVYESNDDGWSVWCKHDVVKHFRHQQVGRHVTGKFLQCSQEEKVCVVEYFDRLWRGALQTIQT